MSNERKSQTLHQAASVLLLSSVLVKIIGALFKIPLSSDYCLGDLGFGYFSSAYDFFTPIYALAISGLPVAVSRVVADFTARNRYKDAENAFFASRKILIISGFVGMGLLAVLVMPFSSLTDKTGLSVYSYFAMIPSVLFCFAASAYKGYYEGLSNMTPAAVSNIIEALGKLILGFGFAFVTVKITGNSAFAAAAAMGGISIGSLLSALYLHIKYKVSGGITKKELSKSLKPYSNQQIVKTVISVSVPIVLSSLSSSIVTLIDALTVRWQLSADMLNLGQIYPMFAQNVEALPTVLYGIRSKAFTLYNLIPTFTMVIGVGSIPAIASAFSKKDKAAVKENVGIVFKLSALITFPAAAGFISLSGKIMSLIYGSGHSAEIGGKMLCIFGFAAIFAGFSIPLGSVLQAVDKQKSALLNVAIGIGVKLAANLILCNIANINIFGSAYATLACYFVIFILHMITLLKTIGKPQNLKNTVFKPLFAAIICGITAYLISLIGDTKIVTILAVAAAVVVYFAFLIATKTFVEADILGLPMGNKLLLICKKAKIIR